MIVHHTQRLSPALLALLLALLLWLLDQNRSLLLLLNSIAPLLPEPFWQSLTFGGDALLLLVAALPLAYRWPHLIWALLLAAVMGGVLTHGGKALFSVARPPAVIESELLQVIGPAWRNGSFPSGHAVSSFTFAAVIGLGLGRAWRWILPLLLLPVALSRAVVGVHWPIDILVGIAIGWCAGVAGHYLARRWPWGSRWPGRPLLLLLLILAAVALLQHDGGYPEAAWLATVVALIGIGSGGRYLWLEWCHYRTRPASRSIFP